MAKVTSDLFGSPGLRAAIELQQRLDEICNPSWLRQVERMEHVERQLYGSQSAYQTLHPAVLSSASAVAQAWPTDRMADVLRRASEVESAIKPLIPALEQYTKLQSALSDRLSEWSAIVEAAQDSLALQKEYSIAHICTLTENLTDIVDSNEEAAIELPSELSSTDKQIIADEVSSILAPEKNWEQRLMDSVAKFKETHPVYAWILYHLFVTILIGIAINLTASVIWQAITSAKVYEAPNPASPVVSQLEPRQQVKVIGEQPYYFQVELTDGNTQETMVGFVSKRSLKEFNMPEEAPTTD